MASNRRSLDGDVSVNVRARSVARATARLVGGAQKGGNMPRSARDSRSRR